LLGLLFRKIAFELKNFGDVTATPVLSELGKNSNMSFGQKEDVQIILLT
jgi:hypothetical protein